MSNVYSAVARYGGTMEQRDRETLTAALDAAQSMIAAGASEVTIYVPPIRLQATPKREDSSTHSERSH